MLMMSGMSDEDEHGNRKIDERWAGKRCAAILSVNHQPQVLVRTWVLMQKCWEACSACRCANRLWVASIAWPRALAACKKADGALLGLGLPGDCI